MNAVPRHPVGSSDGSDPVGWAQSVPFTVSSFGTDALEKVYSRRDRSGVSDYGLRLNQRDLRSLHTAGFVSR